MMYYYAWKNNPKRALLYKRPCRVLARLALNSAVVRFEDGQLECVSRNALRKVKVKRMDYGEFLDRIIGDGIAAAREDYADDPMKLEGAAEGFEMCRGKSPQELVELLAQVRVDRRKAMVEEAEDYWRVRCREAEIEWVCNCVSVVLMGAGDPVIVPPTARAVMKVASVVGMMDVVRMEAV